jgi:hypothetical protein
MNDLHSILFLTDVTFTYLHPIPMQDIQSRVDPPEYANITRDGALRPVSHGRRLRDGPQLRRRLSIVLASEQSDFSDEAPSIEMVNIH